MMILRIIKFDAIGKQSKFSSLEMQLSLTLYTYSHMSKFGILIEFPSQRKKIIEISP